jgi:hypothetical protein
VGKKTEQTVMVDGTQVKRKLPSFIEWWLVFEDEPISSTSPEPSVPEDPRVRALLEGLARQAARGWVKESMVAKGWPATSQHTPSAPTPAKELGSRRRVR